MAARQARAATGRDGEPTDPDWTYRELADNHLALVNDPQATAEVLLSLV
jgi:hypothetical protein